MTFDINTNFLQFADERLVRKLSFALPILFACLVIIEQSLIAINVNWAIRKKLKFQWIVTDCVYWISHIIDISITVNIHWKIWFFLIFFNSAQPVVFVIMRLDICSLTCSPFLSLPLSLSLSFSPPSLSLFLFLSPCLSHSLPLCFSFFSSSIYPSGAKIPRFWGNIKIMTNCRNTR